MVSRGMLEMRGSGQLRISVVVAADGRPSMGTLRVTGSGAGTPQAAVEQWASPSAPSHSDCGCTAAVVHSHATHGT